MHEVKAELVRERRARLWGTLQRLEDTDVRVRVEQTPMDAARTIEEWHDFVEGLDRVVRAVRRYDARRWTRAPRQLAS